MEGREPGEVTADPAREIPEARWAQIWATRPLLRGIARRYGCSAQEAEDAVQDALLRAAEHPEIVAERLPAWLCAVVSRLCLDGYQRRAADTRRRERTAGWAVAQQPGEGVEEQVCAHAKAAWIATLVPDLLPPRQAQALWLAAAGCTVEQVADQLGVRYRAAESLLARGRRTLRTFWPPDSIPT